MPLKTIEIKENCRKSKFDKYVWPLPSTIVVQLSFWSFTSFFLSLSLSLSLSVSSCNSSDKIFFYFFQLYYDWTFLNCCPLSVRTSILFRFEHPTIHFYLPLQQQQQLHPRRQILLGQQQQQQHCFIGYVKNIENSVYVCVIFGFRKFSFLTFLDFLSLNLGCIYNSHIWFIISLLLCAKRCFPEE